MFPISGEKVFRGPVYGASVRFSICIHLLLLSGSVRFVVVRFDLLWFGSICSDSVRFVVVRSKFKALSLFLDFDFDHEIITSIDCSAAYDGSGEPPSVYDDENLDLLLLQPESSTLL
jgi:hypothetical protein